MSKYIPPKEYCIKNLKAVVYIHAYLSIYSLKLSGKFKSRGSHIYLPYFIKIARTEFLLTSDFDFVYILMK